MQDRLIQVSIGLVFLLSASLYAEEFLDRSGPTYASSESKVVIEKMVNAHGGLDRWLNATSISYDFIMHMISIPVEEGMSQWAIWETNHSTYDQRNGRGYQDFRIEDAKNASDGKEIWSLGEKSPMPTRFRLWHHYRFINLPFLTQRYDVILGAPSSGQLPDDDTKYITVRATFKPGEYRTESDYNLLYIDPQTYLLKAVVYVVTYATMLDMFGMPPEAKSMPPMLRRFDDYVTVDGLTIPSRYRTSDVSGQNIMGTHLVFNVSFSRPFDEGKMYKPEDAIIDTTNPTVRQ